MHIVEQVTNGFLSFLSGELRTESELVLVGQELLNERRLDTVLQILEQILEHTAGCTGCRHELKDLVSLLEVLLPCLDVRFLLSTLRRQDAFLRRSRSHNVQLGKTVTETFQLCLRLFHRNTASL